MSSSEDEAFDEENEFLDEENEGIDETGEDLDNPEDDEVSAAAAASSSHQKDDDMDDDDDMDAEDAFKNNADKEREDNDEKDAEGRIPVPKDKRITSPYLTKYERARLLGTRALQISQNAPPVVSLNKETGLDRETDPLKIAQVELQLKKIPLIVRRYLPDGKHYEDWRIDELMFDYDPLK